MSRMEELRQHLIRQIVSDIADNEKSGNEEYGSDMVVVNIITARRVAELLKKLDVPVEAKWHYYMNDEGKPRWRCTNCGKLCRKNPYDKHWCSTCGARITLES